MMRATKSMTSVLLGLLGCDSRIESSQPYPRTCEEIHRGGGGVCIGEEYKTCGELAGTYCSVCGCAVSAQRCDAATDRCATVAPRERGQACLTHADCASANCGTPAGRLGKECLVALGAPCKDDDCSRCVHDGDAAQCTRDCADDSDPAVLDTSDARFVCVVDTLTDAAEYKPLCGASRQPCLLPSQTCWTARGISAPYCDFPAGTLGKPCHPDRTCEAGLYFECRGTCRALALDQLCSADAQCGSGLCAEGCALSSSTAGAERCAALTCSSSYCTPTCKPGGLVRGAACVNDRQCAPVGAEPSGCVDGSCAKRAPNENAGRPR